MVADQRSVAGNSGGSAGAMTWRDSRRAGPEERSDDVMIRSAGEFTGRSLEMSWSTWRGVNWLHKNINAEQSRQEQNILILDVVS